MKIILNGEDADVSENLSVSGLIASYDLPAGKVAVERNLEIVPKSAYASTMLEENDRVEIVHFIGGG